MKKCSNCGFENVHQALYCCRCDHKFSDEELKNAYESTVAAKADRTYSKTKKTWKLITDPLKTILGNKWVKVTLIILLFMLGMYMRNTRQPIWNSLTIIPTDHYSCSKTKDGYRIRTKEDSIELSIGITKNVDTASISVYDSGNKEIGNLENRTVLVNKEYTYVLNVQYQDGTGESLNFYFE